MKKATKPKLQTITEGIEYERTSFLNGDIDRAISILLDLKDRGFTRIEHEPDNWNSPGEFHLIRTRLETPKEYKKRKSEERLMKQKHKSEEEKRLRTQYEELKQRFEGKGQKQ